MKLDNESILREILEQSLAGYWDWDIPSGNVYLSPTFKKMFGYEDYEIQNSLDSWQSLFFAEDWAAVLKTFDEHIKSRSTVPYHNEIRYRHKDGSTVWVICTGNVIEWDTAGAPIRMVGCHVDITQRKQAEEELKKAKTKTEEGALKYRFLISNMMNAFSLNEMIFNEKGQPDDFIFLEVNPMWEAIVGIKAEAVVGKRIKEIMPNIEQGWLNTYGNVVKTGIPSEYLDYNSATKKYYNVFAYKYEGNRFAAIFNDVTERKQAEDELLKAKIDAEKNELKFRTYSEKAPISIYVTDKNGDCIYANELWLRQAGMVLTEALGKGWINALHPEDRNTIGEKWYKSVVSDGTWLFEYRFIDKENNITWVEGSAKELRNSKNEISGYLGTNIDITARKKAEEAIVLSEYKARTILESISDAFFSLDSNLVVTYFNAAAERLLNRKASDVLGHYLFDSFPEAKGSVFDEKYHQAIREKITLNFEVFFDVPPYRNWYEVRVYPQEAGISVYFQVVTERKRIEEELNKAQKLESLGLLAGGIAHDFNNLLGGIFGNIEMAAEETKEKHTANYLAKVNSAFDRVRALTRQLLTFAKGGAPIKTIERLSPFIEDTAKFALSGSNVSLRCFIAQDLWLCEFDKNQIGQVVDNILINAQQAMPEGGTIELNAENIQLVEKQHMDLPPGSYVKIAIKDHGIGMPKNILQKIFDPFFTTKAQGHGLGLATCYSIIKRHGGCIDVESNPGKGSTFTIYLPASTGAATTKSAVTTEIHKGAGSILVMDDSEVMRETVRSMLKAMGYQVYCVSNSLEAVELFKKVHEGTEHLVALILDLTIPGEPGGKETIREIRKINTDIPAFVVSGYADDPVMANPTEYGFIGCICKPFRKSELAELLNKHIKKAK